LRDSGKKDAAGGISTMSPETSNRGHVQSRQHGITPEAPPRLSNGERAAMRKATNDFLKASAARMDSKVKFTARAI
jgi:hypothetical protein